MEQEDKNMQAEPSEAQENPKKQPQPWGSKKSTSVKAEYDAPEDPNMPRRCTEIYLTLELFSGTASIMEDVLRDLEKSVAYWRAIIPQDGKPLDCSL